MMHVVSAATDAAPCGIFNAWRYIHFCNIWINRQSVIFGKQTLRKQSTAPTIDHMRTTCTYNADYHVHTISEMTIAVTAKVKI
jgi:hypothetical protein